MARSTPVGRANAHIFRGRPLVRGAGTRTSWGSGLLAGLDRPRYRLVSSEDLRSSLGTVEPLREPAGQLLERLSQAGMYVAHRRGRIRISPHLYDTPSEIDRLVALL